MVIFHSYVSLPEGKGYEKYKLNMFITWEKSKKMSQWIGVVGKIETGNHGVFTIKHTVIFPITQVYESWKKNGFKPWNLGTILDSAN